MATVTTKRVAGTASGGQTARVSEAPALDVTKRITAAAAGGSTKRVSGTPGGGATSFIHHLLLLEGDEDGYLLLEGDMQSGNDALKLEGDAATIGSTVTKRITEAVA
jgi:ABC-type polar amino acid transport system ATPase subunit